MTRRKSGPLTLCLLLTGFLLPSLAATQGLEEPPLPPPGYVPPDKAEWMAAGLRMEEYDMAVRYEATLEEWKEMHTSRRAHTVAGWACIALGPLAAGVAMTIHFASDFKFQNHPEQEVYIVTFVAAGALVITGIVLLAGAPGPEDIKKAWMRKQAISASEPGLFVAPSPGGLGLGIRF